MEGGDFGQRVDSVGEDVGNRGGYGGVIMIHFFFGGDKGNYGGPCYMSRGDCP